MPFAIKLYNSYRLSCYNLKCCVFKSGHEMSSKSRNVPMLTLAWMRMCCIECNFFIQYCASGSPHCDNVFVQGQIVLAVWLRPC